MPLKLRSQSKAAPQVEKEQPKRRQAKEKEPPQEATPEPDKTQENVSVRVSPSAAQDILSRQPVVRLQRYVTRNSVQENGKEVEEPPRPPPPRRKKRVRKEVREETPPPNDNILLPDVSLFPEESDLVGVKAQKLRELRNAVCSLFGIVFNQIQDDADNLLPCYESIESVYELFDKAVGGKWGSDQERIAFGEKYRRACLSALWDFGAVIWKQNVEKGALANPYSDRASKFLQYCLVHLGWKSDKRKDSYLREWKHPDYQPASYLALRFFHKNHNDANSSSRQAQLLIVNKFLENATRIDDVEYIRVAWEIIGKCLTIRIKDKQPSCRALVLKILSHFVVLEDAAPECQKLLKYYTRYDHSVEVRRIGTKIIGEKTRIKLRFFYDQAFDKSEAVRVEAFKGMAVKERGDALVREMGDLQSDKLCKCIVWGALYSGGKCNSIVKNEIMPNWLKISCNRDLVLFLHNIDAFQHMKAVIKILDMLLTTQNQESFVESIDLSFIPKMKNDLKVHDYKAVSIEAFVAWLGLCKASENVESIRSKVIPDSDEMFMLIEALHACVFKENEMAKEERRSEDVTCVFCLVIALEISKRFVAWEEGNRRRFIRLVQEILEDPLLDDRVIVVQSISTLHAFMDEHQFEDTMMTIFQDLFDSRNRINRSNASFVEYGRGVSREASCMSVDQIEHMVEYRDVTPEPPQVVRKTAYELTKMREKLCELGLKRFNLQKKKEALLKDKLFIDAIPVNTEIFEIQQREKELGDELKAQEEIFKGGGGVGEGGRDFRNEMVKSNAELVRRSLAVTHVSEREEDGEGGEEEGNKGNRVVITSVEEGLCKALAMINSFLDVCPKMGAFVRNIYDSHISTFLNDGDVNIRVSVLQFITRIGLIDHREVRKVFSFMVKTLVGVCEIELKNVAFQSIVDLIICYEYKDLLIKDGDKEGDYVYPFWDDLDKYMNEMLVNENVEYESSTPEQMERFVLELLTKRFPPNTDMNATELNILNTTKNVGLLKLLVRGRLRDPSIIAKILCLWVNHDYAGTAVLRDLEHVLKLYGMFEWWGGDFNCFVNEIQGEIEGEVQRSSMMRVLGVAIAEGVVLLCQDPRVGGGGKDGEENCIKFCSYFISFLDHTDQSLMRTIVSTILSPIASNPTRSYNSLLVRCASRIPITSAVSASSIVMLIGDLFQRMKEYPLTASVSILRKELCTFLGKLKRVFGDNIAVVNENGKERVIGVDQGWGEDEDDDAVEFNEDEEVDG